MPVDVSLATAHTHFAPDRRTASEAAARSSLVPQPLSSGHVPQAVAARVIDQPVAELAVAQHHARIPAQ
jgi:hypothetical protein